VSDLGDEVVFVERDLESSASKLPAQRSDESSSPTTISFRVMILSSFASTLPARLISSHPPRRACQSLAASPAASNSTVRILMVMCAAMDTATLRLRQAIHVIGRNPRKIAGYLHGEKKW
jgi:hypothetical protein